MVDRLHLGAPKDHFHLWCFFKKTIPGFCCAIHRRWRFCNHRMGCPGDGHSCMDQWTVNMGPTTSPVVFLDLEICTCSWIWEISGNIDLIMFKSIHLLKGASNLTVPARFQSIQNLELVFPYPKNIRGLRAIYQDEGLFWNHLKQRLRHKQMEQQQPSTAIGVSQNGWWK